VLTHQPSHLKKVSLALYGLTSVEAPEQLSLFPSTSPIGTRSQEERITCEKLSRVLDAVTKRYGRHSLTLGLTEQDGKSFTGTKIAFNRIPEREDFEQWDETGKAMRDLEHDLLPVDE
jgi:DNA polymerase-4